MAPSLEEEVQFKPHFLLPLVTSHLKKPVIRIVRIAGQYAKPRSSPTETVNSQTLPSYRGDMINGAAFTEAARTPDPRRMLKALARSQHPVAVICDPMHGNTQTTHGDGH